MQSEPVENIFARAWSLLTANPVIVVPGLVVGVLVGVIDALAAPHVAVDASGTPGVVATLSGGAAAAASAGISLAVGILGFLINQTFTTGMAGAAWQTGRATLADGRASFSEDAGRLLGAALLVAIVGIVAGIVTLGFGWFVVLFFAIYVVPAVVLDNFAPLPAFRLSARIATRRLLSTLIIIVMLFAIGIVVGLIALPLAVVPFVGPIVVAVVSQAVTAYTTLVIVGEYLATRRAPDIMPASPL